MAVSVLTFVNWRSTLVAIQGALSGTLTSAVSAEGYALLSALNVAGTAYDQQGDDSPRNTSSFSTGITVVGGIPVMGPGAQPFMIAATPLFIEADRVARLIYSTYASTATLAQGQAFGLYPGATVLPPGLTAPAPLVLTWDAASALMTQLFVRLSTASGIVESAGNAPLAALLTAAFAAVLPYASPPVNPSPIAAAASHVATVAVNAAVVGAQTWISSLSFS